MKRLAYYLLLVSPLFIVPLGLFVGSANIPTDEVLRILTIGFKGLVSGKGLPQGKYALIIWDLRLPRLVWGLAVGASLSVSGAVLQAIFQNPLVDTYILGIAAGGAFGATLALVLGWSLAMVPLAFIFALLAVILSCFLGQIDHTLTPLSLVLAGIIVNAFFSALTSLLKLFLSHQRLAEVFYWLMGSLNVVGWSQLKWVLPFVILGLWLIFLMRWQLNVLSLENSLLEGRANLIRLVFIILVSVITAISVAFCGIIGWVGLIVPHLIRLAFGADHKLLIPLCGSVGASLLVLADILSRSLASYEVPLGLLTALLGLPFLAYLIKRSSQLQAIN